MRQTCGRCGKIRLGENNFCEECMNLLVGEDAHMEDARVAL
jgi:hypothetical protein